MINLRRPICSLSLLFLSLQGFSSFAQSISPAADSMIDGSKEPSRIPQDVAFRLVLYSLNVPTSPTAADLRKQEARLDRIALTPEDKATLKTLLTSFQQDLGFIQTTSSDSSLQSQLAMGRERDELLNRYQHLIHSQLSLEGDDKFMAYVLAERSKMRCPAKYFSFKRRNNAMSRHFFPLSAVLFCLASSPLFAQSYYDIVFDGVELDADLYAEAGTPASCPSGVEISETLSDLSGSADASYPNVAQVSLHLPNPVDNTSYNWRRIIITMGQQRGGNCGVIRETDLAQVVELHSTYYQPPVILRDLPNGQVSCQYSALDCAPGTTPYCEGGWLGVVKTGYCPGHVQIRFVVVAGVCTAGHLTDTTNLPQAEKICN